MKQRIIAFHLLNDKSGSPKVLRQLLLDWANDDQFDVHLFSSLNTDGFLSNLENVKFHQMNLFISTPFYLLEQH